MGNYPGLQTRVGDVLVVQKEGVSLILVGPVHDDGVESVTSTYEQFTNMREAKARARELVAPGRRMYLLLGAGDWSEFA